MPVHGFARVARSRHLQRLGPAAQGGMVGHGEIEAEQPQDGADQPLALAQRQAEHGTERQSRRDRQAGVARLTAPAGARLRMCTRINALLRPGLSDEPA